MNNKIPFSIIFENQNIDFFFEGHSETKDRNHLTRITTEILILINLSKRPFLTFKMVSLQKSVVLNFYIDL